MTWIGAIGRALSTLAKPGGCMATYLLGRSRTAKGQAERAAKTARDANRTIVDETDDLGRATAERIVAHNRKIQRFCR